MYILVSIRMGTIFTQHPSRLYLEILILIFKITRMYSQQGIESAIPSPTHLLTIQPLLSEKKTNIHDDFFKMYLYPHKNCVFIYRIASSKFKEFMMQISNSNQINFKSHPYV